MMKQFQLEHKHREREREFRSARKEIGHKGLDALVKGLRQEEPSGSWLLCPSFTRQAIEEI